ncbi:MAG: gluconate 2-dehydrogenase subunit 3 family protein [Alphaproteobacteria bacterium]|nr:gluconate 2-dehydrogenase subunit 3 family protein [Alphaproteobacteria bacterium]
MRYIGGVMGGLVTANFFPTTALSKENSLERKTFRAFIDTLLPQTDTPSGSSLKVDEDVLRLVQQNRNYTLLVDWGVKWLNHNANLTFSRDFYRLSPSEQIILVEMAEKTPASYNANSFFNHVLFDAKRLYYKNPKAWENLNVNDSLQPKGYPDHSQAPSIQNSAHE